MDGKRLVELDAVRGLAAMAVVMYHYFYRYDGLYGHHGVYVDWAQLGRFGVQLFFIVSGFVIFWTLKKINDPLDFVVSRLSRIFPAFIASVILTFLAVNFFGLSGREVLVKDAILNFFMIHEYFGVPHVDGVYWTLTIEITFYCWMFIIFACGLLEKTEYFFIPIFVLNVLSTLGWVDFGVLGKVFLFKYAPFFLAGVCYYRLFCCELVARSYWFLVLSIVMVVVLYPLKVAVLLLLFHALFFLLITRNIAFLKSNFLIFIGSISYPLYLLHQNIGYIVINFAYANNINPLFGIVLAITLVVFLSYFFHLSIERRCMAFLRDKYARVKGS